MKLWLIEPRPGAWQPGYDMACAFVVRAETAREARKIADAHGGDESRGASVFIDSQEEPIYQPPRPWLTARLSRCRLIGEALGRETQPALIVRDFKAG